MNLDRDTSRLLMFIALSLLLHIAAAVALFLFAPKEATQPLNAPYIVSLVPDEFQPPPQPAPPAEERKVPVAKTPPVPLKRMPRVKEPPPTEFRREGGSTEEPVKQEPAGQAFARREGGAQAGKRGVSTGESGEEASSEKPGFLAEPPANKQKQSAASAGGAAGEEGLGSKLFDKDVLAKVVEEGKGEKKSKDSKITFDTKEIRHWGYMQRLKERIEYVWEYPRSAAMQGIYGDLVLEFVIKRDGELGAIDLVRTSGRQDLDRAAMQALKDGAPYWPLPDEWESDSITVTGHFIYTLGGYNYIR